MADVKDRHPERGEAMAHAYRSEYYTLAQAGNHFGIGYAPMSRAIKKLGM